jgi:hypothetical protein
MTDETKWAFGGEAQAIVSLARLESEGAAGLLGVVSSDGGWRAPASLSGNRLWPLGIPSSTAPGT